VASLAPAYLPRKPLETVLHQLVRQNLEAFLAHARERYEGGLPRYVEQECAPKSPAVTSVGASLAADATP
jgi:hypothetical protein